MGYKLANAAYEAGLAGIISERGRLALDHMCRHARDVASKDTPAGIYLGGYLGIGMCLLGLEKGAGDAGKTAAKRVIRELTKAGLIELYRGAAQGRNAEYRILIGGDLNGSHPVDNSLQDPLLER